MIAKLRNLRIAPRKVRLVADLIRGKRVEEAQTILNLTIKKACQPLLKLLNSAHNNAKYNFGLEKSNFFISKITVDEGKKLKRWRARARGRAAAIQKKTSHITLVLDTIEKKFEEDKSSSHAEPDDRKVRREKRTKFSSNPFAIAREIKKKPLKIKKTKEVKEKIEKTPKIKKPKLQRPESEIKKPKIERGIKKIFKRKAF
ncbi:MAG: 50S ribosomal protein L22 [Candidatus Nealsonbacteria bacterium]|nr:50S ribosomal protein L22 [Candidatus Nealsonbacteria bacterium]